MELMMRLELMTSSLPRMCATTCATSASCPLGQLCYDTTFGGILQAFFLKKIDICDCAQFNTAVLDFKY